MHRLRSLWQRLWPSKPRPVVSNPSKPRAYSEHEKALVRLRAKGRL